jgi:hypothetical protein
MNKRTDISFLRINLTTLHPAFRNVPLFISFEYAMMGSRPFLSSRDHGQDAGTPEGLL